MNSFQDLDVWNKAHELTLEVYKITTDFPKEERYGLRDQLCRSAASVPANIVEGQARQTTKEYIRFLYNARGSLAETKYHLLLAKDLNYLENSNYQKLVETCASAGKMLNGLINSLKCKQSEQSKC